MGTKFFSGVPVVVSSSRGLGPLLLHMLHYCRMASPLDLLLPRCTVQLCRVRPCRLADNGVLWEGVFHLPIETGLILHVLSYRTGLVLISTGLPPEFIQADSPSFNEIR